MATCDGVTLHSDDSDLERPQEWRGGEIDRGTSAIVGGGSNTAMHYYINYLHFDTAALFFVSAAGGGTCQNKKQSSHYSIGLSFNPLVLFLFLFLSVSLSLSLSLFLSLSLAASLQQQVHPSVGPFDQITDAPTAAKASSSS
jgi:hypothetical protein